jgi:putative transposase
LFLPPDFLGQVNSIQWRGKHLLKELDLLLLGSTITPKKVNPVKRDFHVSRSVKLIAEVEYKTTGRKLSFDRRTINLTDGFEAGSFKLWGTRDLHFYQLKQIKRVRVVPRSHGYYCQFCIDIERIEKREPTGKTIGLDLGLTHFYTDSSGQTVDRPRHLRKSEKALKRLNRRLSRTKKGSKNRASSRNRLSRKHLKVSRQRKNFAVKLAFRRSRI